jgi:hypothetical protein
VTVSELQRVLAALPVTAWPYGAVFAVQHHLRAGSADDAANKVSLNMISAFLQRVLQGDEEAIASFGEAEHCAGIDWRDRPTEIVSAIAAFLPTGYLVAEDRGDSTYGVVVHEEPPRSVLVSWPTKQEDLLARINAILSPDFELRQFRPFDGDGYSLFVAPRAVWSEIERTHPEATERLFLTADRLAAYWRKGYLARLFSKP